MRYVTFLPFFVLVLFLAGCASQPKYKEDPAVTRSRAHAAYDDLDAETGSSATFAKKTGSATENGVTMSYEASSAMENAPTIMVMPAKSGKGLSELAVVNSNPLSKSMMEAINSYLTQKHYEVRSLEGQSQLDDVIKMQNDIANTDDDLSYLASLALGADIYIKYSGSANTDNVTIEVSAYETSTARLLGSQTAEVKNNGHVDQANLRANVQSAARKAMPGLEKKILAYWEDDLKKGAQYKVVMNLKGEYSDSQIEDLHDYVVRTLRQTFNSVTVNVLTGKTIDLVVYADPGKFVDSQDVYSQIRQQLKAMAESRKINVTKKLILMDLQ